MKRSQELFAEAQKHFVAGVCAGGRFNHVLGGPLYIDHADGCYVYDVDGNKYIDYHSGSGAIMFGFNNPQIKKALEKALSDGYFMNFDSEPTVEFGNLFKQLVPTAEKIRLSNSGTEASMAAIRLARAYTGKNIIIKMDGQFHGMHEMIWYNGGYGTDYDEFGETRTVNAETPGFPKNGSENVKLIEFNNIDAVKHAFKKYRGDIAAIIMEPVGYDCGCTPSTIEYMQQVRALCDEEGILMIFDEVITGLRFRPGSAQGYYGIKPDLSIFAKAVANGFSLALIAGKAEVMDYFNPTGPVTCSGTSTGNYLSVVAAVECVKMALEPGFYDMVEKKEKMLNEGINDLFKKHGIPGHIRTMGAQFGIYFGCEDPEMDYRLSEVVKSYRPDLYKEFVRSCLENGIYFLFGGSYPFPHHCGFNAAHTEEDITVSLEKFDSIFANLKKLV